ncbi:MAG: DNA-3-methyladenine glycosylase I [Acidobacteria bacterium]|nr:DNA-3-methyladenine glycosylase I [Acidobacteriota bacterium]
MDLSQTYCGVAQRDPLHKPYHDTEYGFPIETDDGLFERLVLEINQAGLSWATILRKRAGFRAAYSEFSIDAVAAYGRSDIERLLGDASIIRNRLKIHAAVANARHIQEIRQSHGSFRRWLDTHHPLPKSEWVRLFKNTFRFTGGEIVGEFLMSSGYLPGAHHPDCPIEKKVRKVKPAWLETPLDRRATFT